MRPVEVVATTTLLKVLLAPVLILLATLAGRRWGPAVGGWLAGLPLTSGPVSFILALEQGPEFAARAALGTLFGLVSLAAFCLAYGVGGPAGGMARLSRRRARRLRACRRSCSGTRRSRSCSRSPSCAPFSPASAPVMAGGEPPRPPRRLLPGDLAIRMALAALLVLVLTSVAAALGPALAGSLIADPGVRRAPRRLRAPRPGRGGAVQLLRGMALGSFGFATFLLWWEASSIASRSRRPTCSRRRARSVFTG